MPEVNVLVDHAVHHEEPPAELVDVAQRRGPPVPIRIVPGSTHILFGVGGVVALVKGNRRPGDAGFEDVGGRGERHQRHVAAVTPAVDADPRYVGKAEGAQPAHPFDLVADLDAAHPARDRRLEPQPAARRAAVIHLHDDEPVLGQHLRP